MKSNRSISRSALLGTIILFMALSFIATVTRAQISNNPVSNKGDHSKNATINPTNNHPASVLEKIAFPNKGRNKSKGLFPNPAEDGFKLFCIRDWRQSRS